MLNSRGYLVVVENMSEISTPRVNAEIQGLFQQQITNPSSAPSPFKLQNGSQVYILSFV